MQKCPVCRCNAWQDGLYGYQKCPNCASKFLVGKDSILPDTRRNTRYLAPATRKARDRDSVNGQVICAACIRPCVPVSAGDDSLVLAVRRLDIPDQNLELARLRGLPKAVDGRIETDGTSLIDVRTGWTLAQDNETFLPHYERRTIPKHIRGWICLDCQLRPGFHEVGDEQLRLSRDNANQGDKDIRGGRLYYKLDPDPTWAHTGNNDWIGRSSYRQNFEFSDRWIFRRSFHQKPISVYGWLSGSQMILPTVRPMRAPYLEGRLGRLGRSPNRVVIGHSRRERIGRSLTIADTLAAATRHAIALGDATAAWQYARMAARHPAAQRVIKG